MWVFIGLMLTIYFLACAILIFVILIQSGKGGGLSSLGSASQGISDALGATGAEKALNRMTTWAAVGFMVLAIVLSLAGGVVARQKSAPLLPESKTSPVSQPIQQRATLPNAPAAAGPAAPAKNDAAPVNTGGAPQAPAPVAPNPGAQPAGQ